MQPSTRRTNWARNVTFAEAAFHAPTSVPELQALVASSDTLRVLGTGHSFSEIADTTGDLVSLAWLPPRIDIDGAASTVTVSGGVRYGELGKALEAADLALINTGSLPHISVAGASSTGTHGSGNTIGNLSTVVSALELVRADGELVHLSRAEDGDAFNGMVLGLGCLGIITALTLEVVPSFVVQQDVYDDLPHQELLAHFEEISASGYSVSAFSTWRRPHTHQIWRKFVVDSDTSPGPAAMFGAVRAGEDRSPLGPGWPTDNITAQRTPGPWNERLPHFRLDFTPSSGEELQSEFMIDRSLAGPALRALDDIADRIADVLQVTELRTVAADEIWLSPSYRRDSVCLHFTWIDRVDDVMPVVTAVEDRLDQFAARPHWGKVFTSSAATIHQRYERLADFRELASRYDSTGKFRNAMVDRLIFTG